MRHKMCYKRIHDIYREENFSHQHEINIGSISKASELPTHTTFLDILWNIWRYAAYIDSILVHHRWVWNAQATAAYLDGVSGINVYLDNILAYALKNLFNFSPNLRFIF